MINSTSKVAIVGAGGRMGLQLIKILQSQTNLKLSVAIENKNSLLLKTDVGKLIGINDIGVIITDSLNETNNDFDVLIDFSSPKSTLKYLTFCKEKSKAMVIGTTGFDDQSKKTIFNASEIIPIVFSSNFSIGSNLLLKLLEKTTKTIGSFSDIEIIETHHNNKTDSPSGTALEIGKVIANSLKKKIKECVVKNRVNVKDRSTGKIVFTSIRSGDVVGDHTVMFSNIGERIEITHRVSNRIIFAKGAIKAANWIINKKPGLYNMKDVLNKI